MEMKRKEVVDTCRGVAQSCLLLDGKAVAKDDAGKRHEVDIRSLAVGVGVGLTYAEAMLSGRVDACGEDCDTQARDIVESAAMTELKYQAGEL